MVYLQKFFSEPCQAVEEIQASSGDVLRPLVCILQANEAWICSCCWKSKSYFIVAKLLWLGHFREFYGGLLDIPTLVGSEVF